MPSRPPIAKTAKLSAKQQRFVEEYVVDLNATQAAIRAGYSEKTAYSQGQRLLKHVEVAAIIAEHQERLANRAEVTAERILQELARIAFVDPRAIFAEDGSVKPIPEWEEDIARALSGCEVTEEFAGRGADREQVGFTKKVKFWDKRGALELLGKHLALFTDKVEHSGKVEGGVLIVPAPVTTEDWAAAAEGQQREIAAKRAAGE